MSEAVDRFLLKPVEFMRLNIVRPVLHNGEDWFPSGKYWATLRVTTDIRLPKDQSGRVVGVFDLVRGRKTGRHRAKSR